MTFRDDDAAARARVEALEVRTVAGDALKKLGLVLDALLLDIRRSE
jgi:hypothetical protein